MKNFLMALLLFTTIGIAAAWQPEKKQANDERVVLIMLDGYRWQELYGGADKRLINLNFVTDSNKTSEKYYRINGAERRYLLMPFLWSKVKAEGSMAGNRWKGSRVEVANGIWKSYAGYNETLCGLTDDEFIHDNSKKYNRNTSILEIIDRSAMFKDSIAAVTSWDVFPYILNVKRSGLDVDYRSDKMITKQVRSDDVTFAKAMQKLKNNHPKFLFVSFCETDYYGHIGKYDRYLDAAHRSDEFIRKIYEYCQHDPFYRGKTTFIVTTDHGRGCSNTHPEEWQQHGHNIKGSNQTWMVAFGKGVKRNGEMAGGSIILNRQLPTTIATILDMPESMKARWNDKAIQNIFNYL